MIVSASRREDLPAFRMDWLMDRLREGSCEVPNPFDARRTRRVRLDPAEVECLVLWTRDSRPLAGRVRELESMGHRFYVHVTLTGYPSSLEPGTVREAEAVSAFAALADLVGPARVIWRYDPIIVARELDPDFHRKNFERLAAALKGATNRVTLSLLDEYARTRARLERAGLSGVVFGSPRVPAEDAPLGIPRNTALLASDSAAPPMAPVPYPELLADLAAIARSRGMESVACAEPYDLSGLGIARGACVDAALIGKLFGIAADPAKDRGQRPACGCAPSVDIGEYGRCPGGCAYCYARR
jgi:hypothetical protein